MNSWGKIIWVLSVNLILVLPTLAIPNQNDGHWQEKDQFSKIGKVSSGIDHPATVKIIYDNYVHKEGMEADWGFSCFIEGIEKNILFDTGTKADLFVRNLKKLEIDPKEVDIVVLTHEHGDHTGGLFAFLELNHDVSVLMPHSFSENFVKKVEANHAKAVTLKEPVEVCKDVFLSGEMGVRIKEHSLAINTKKGLVVITGCSHPGIVDILKRFKNVLKKDIYLVFGGFHLMQKSENEMNTIIDQMKALGVQKVGATHCTGDKQIDMFKKAFGEDYVPIGVGNIITF